MTDTPSQARYRRLVKRLNGVITGLQKAGIAFGPMQLLTVAGRKSGEPRTFPIAVIPIEGRRYIFQAYPRAAWVANARAADQADDTVTLRRGRRASTVRLHELPVDERGPLLRTMAASAPASVTKRFVTTGLSDSAAPEAIAGNAARIAVFRVDPA